MLKVRGLSIEPRSSKIYIDLSMHVYRFPDLKARHVHHMLTCVYFLSCVCFYCTAVYCLFFYLYLFSHFSKLLKLRFLTHSTLHSLILLNSEAKIFNTLFYSLIFLSC